jgi:hypothetical protein
MQTEVKRRPLWEDDDIVSKKPRYDVSLDCQDEHIPTIASELDKEETFETTATTLSPSSPEKPKLSLYEELLLLSRGNIAEKVKLSRRKASEKSPNPDKTNSLVKSPKVSSESVFVSSKHKSPIHSNAKQIKNMKLGQVHAKTENETTSPGKQKHPLRISLKLNLSKNKRLNGNNIAYPSKTKPPPVIQIGHKRVYKVKRAKSSASSSSSSSSCSSSGSSTDSSDDNSDESSSDSSSTSSSSSSSSGSSSSSSSSSSSMSSSSSSINRFKRHNRKHQKVNIQARQNNSPKKRNPQVCKLKIRGTQQCQLALEKRKAEKNFISRQLAPEECATSRPLTAAELKSILAEDDAKGCEAAGSWVRRSTRQPSRSAITAPNVRAIVQKLEMNDPDMVVLKCKKYLSDPDTPSVIVDAMLDALEKNTNCQALYIQNFNYGMKDDQVLHLLRILQQPSCNIWCLNIGETYNVKRKTWAQFTNGLKRTKITHMYASEHTISSAMKEKIREIIRDNRKKHDLHINPENLEVIVQCTHCWWNPINAKVLRPYIKQRGFEDILNDKTIQGVHGYDHT